MSSSRIRPQARRISQRKQREEEYEERLYEESGGSELEELEDLDAMDSAELVAALQVSQRRREKEGSSEAVEAMREFMRDDRHTEYNKEYFLHLQQVEAHHADASSVSHLHTRERRLCVRWIVQATGDYGFLPEVGALSVAYFDGFIRAERSLLGNTNAPEQKCFRAAIIQAGSRILQKPLEKKHTSSACELICIVCIAIAAKRLEPHARAPFLGDFNENFTLQELQRAEWALVEAINFDLSHTTPYHFIPFWLPSDSSRENVRSLCNEAISVCLEEPHLACHRPSTLGAAAVLWARTVVNGCMYDQHLQLCDVPLPPPADDTYMVSMDVAALLHDRFPLPYSARDQAASPTPSRSAAPSPESVLEMPLSPRGLLGRVGTSLKRPISPDLEPQTVTTFDGTEVQASKRRCDGTAMSIVRCLAGQGS